MQKKIKCDENLHTDWTKNPGSAYYCLIIGTFKVGVKFFINAFVLHH